MNKPEHSGGPFEAGFPVSRILVLVVDAEYKYGMNQFDHIEYSLSILHSPWYWNEHSCNVVCREKYG
jgi:hypothetical protein